MLLVDPVSPLGLAKIARPCWARMIRFQRRKSRLSLPSREDSFGQALGQAAADCGIALKSGVFLAVSGPSYETPAEIRAFATLGADAVAMSTVPEAIVARQLGIEIAGLSCITNAAAGLGQSTISHEEVLHQSRQSGSQATKLLTRFCELSC